MRLSRGCYDKFHRCPGWIGGGDYRAKVVLCDSGRIQVDYEEWFWWLKFQRCNRCDVLVLPHFTKNFDPTWYRAIGIRGAFRRWYDQITGIRYRIRGRWFRWVNYRLPAYPVRTRRFLSRIFRLN